MVWHHLHKTLRTSDLRQFLPSKNLSEKVFIDRNAPRKPQVPREIWGVCSHPPRHPSSPPGVTATLECIGDFKSVLTYDNTAALEEFVSLTMPVRTELWVWDGSLHPIFRMNLPEGYLLHVLEERFGPHIGASPVALDSDTPNP